MTHDGSPDATEHVCPHISFCPIFLVSVVTLEVTFCHNSLRFASIIVVVVHIVLGYLNIGFDMVQVAFASPEGVYYVAIPFGLTAQIIHLLVELFLILGTHLQPYLISFFLIKVI